MGRFVSHRRSVLVRLAFVNVVLCALAGTMPYAFAQAVPDQIPGPADANRIAPQPQKAPPEQGQAIRVDGDTLPSTAIPEGADQIHLTLEGVSFENVTAFTPAELNALYATHIGQDITLNTVYEIADALTRLYRAQGYFLSMAYVPDQKIGGGKVKIAAIEGHIAQVELEKGAVQRNVLSQYIQRLYSYKPVKSDQLESFLLRINDLPGADYRAVLAQMPEGNPGSVKLVLMPSDEKGRGQISFDNFGSRYLGPHELSIFYSKSFIPMTTTSLSALTSLPTKELRYFTAEQSVTVAPDVRVKVAGNITRSTSGYTLKTLDVVGDSSDISAAVEWQPVRQRDKNVLYSFKLERRDTKTDILGTPFSRDRVRAVRATVHYDGRNYISGYDFIDGLQAQCTHRRSSVMAARASAGPMTRLKSLATTASRRPSNCNITA